LIVFKLRADLHAYLSGLRQAGKHIGFVPTMGALHPGHLSLIRQAQKENDVVVCSIFVNPTQFNNPLDLSSYPRVPEKDLELLAEAGCDVVYLPEASDVYSDSTDYSFDLGHIDRVMEAAHRPGHFNGVINVVKRLFEIVNPQQAYFGQKDLQQCLVVKQLVRQYGLSVNIRVCPLIREADGLAMSSRNALLPAELRKKAGRIYDALLKGASQANSHTPLQVKEFIRHYIEQDADFKTDYVEITEGETLLPVSAWADAQNSVACVAVHLGGVRLIDNMVIK
jgi:pantoate--beta-alanine ligase